MNQPQQKRVPLSELQLTAMFCDIDDFCKRFELIYHSITGTCSRLAITPAAARQHSPSAKS
jgi:hypothetical protein